MKPEMISFDVHRDHRGKLVVIERCIPFDIKRVFYIHNVPKGETRGNHALRTCHLVLVPVVGAFTVWVGGQSYRLTEIEAKGLYIRPMTWLVLDGFTFDAVCLALASHEYDEADYIWDKEAY